eukprot:gene17418-biopygen11384
MPSGLWPPRPPPPPPPSPRHHTTYATQQRHHHPHQRGSSKGFAPAPNAPTGPWLYKTLRPAAIRP